MTERQPDLGHEYDVSGVWSFHHQTALLFAVVFGIRPASRDCNCCVNAGYIVSFVLIMADGIPPKVRSKGEGPRPADENAASDNFVSFSFDDREFWKWGHTVLSFRIMVEGILPKVLSKEKGPPVGQENGEQYSICSRVVNVAMAVLWPQHLLLCYI